jgi:hypothetical protein
VHRYSTAVPGNQGARQGNCVPFDGEVKVIHGLAEQQVPHSAANNIQGLAEAIRLFYNEMKGSQAVFAERAPQWFCEISTLHSSTVYWKWIGLLVELSSLLVRLVRVVLPPGACQSICERLPGPGFTRVILDQAGEIRQDLVDQPAALDQVAVGVQSMWQVAA